MSSIGPCTDFTQFVRDHERLGCDILGEERRYLPPSAQDEYWSRANVLAVRNSHRPKFSADVNTIQSRYKGVFSLLVYTDQIAYFDDSFLSREVYDDRFPLISPFSAWPDASRPLYKTIYNAIEHEQWTFFPLIFNPQRLLNRRLSPHQILPITKRKVIQKSRVADVEEITIDDSCNELVGKGPDGCPTQKVFVLKTYHGEYKTFYERERLAFVSLQNTPSDNIIHLYGSFVQGNQYCLLLEHANAKTLGHFFKMEPPSTVEEVLQFWKSYCGLFEGLDRVHQEFSEVRGIHGDIKPDNILCTRGPSGSLYDFIPKIADFGHSHFRNVGPDEEDGLGLDRHGNQRYSAPEASHHNEIGFKGPNRIDHKADMFAAGALTSEFAVWVPLGREGLSIYTKMRQDAPTRASSFEGSGYSTCFHDGVKRLPEVDQMHRIALKALPTFDLITPQIIALLQNGLLLDNASNRWSAKRVKSQIEQDLDTATRDLKIMSISSTVTATPIALRGVSSDMAIRRQSSSTVSRNTSVTDKHLSTSTSNTGTESLDGVCHADGTLVCDHEEVPVTSERPEPGLRVQHQNTCDSQSSKSSSATLRPQGSRSPLHSTQSSSSSPSRRTPPLLETQPSTPLPPWQMCQLSIDDLQEYRDAKKAKRPVPPQIAEGVRQTKSYAKNRDHVFLIDDSESMKVFKSDAEHAFQVLSYLAKAHDTDGIELVFLSDPTRVYRKKETSSLAYRFNEYDFTLPPDMMESHFEVFISYHLVPRFKPRLGWMKPKPVSVFVLTDGRWGRGGYGAGGVENPLRRLIDSLLEHDLPRTHVMLSFIRFGDDDVGKESLNFLDEYGKVESFRDKRNRMVHFDIVDTGPISGNIVKLFVGSISQRNDDDDVTTTEASYGVGL